MRRRTRRRLGIAAGVLVGAFILAGLIIPPNLQTDDPVETFAPVTPFPTPTPVVPPPISRPAAGVYIYDATTNDETVESTLEVRNDGGDRQIEILDGTLTNEVAWRDDGKYWLVTTFGVGDASASCDWEPDNLALELPLAQGRVWASDVSCELLEGLDVFVSTDARVVGPVRRRVGDEAVDCWLVRYRTTVAHETAQGSSQEESQGEFAFSPAHGVAITAEETTVRPHPVTGEPVERFSTRVLRSLTPR